MQARKRIKQLLGEPSYRIRLGFFSLLGTTVILLSILVKNAFWSNVFFEFAIVFIAVAMIDFLWDFLGGDPMEIQVQEVQAEITHTREHIDSQLSTTVDSLSEELVSLKHSMSLMTDLIEGNIGIERIWPDRRTWHYDDRDGSRQWQSRLCQADEVDIMSNTLWQSWMRPSEFRRALFENIAGGAQVRILIYAQDSKGLEFRARDEGDVPGEMQHEIKSTLVRLAEQWEGLDVSVRDNLQVRLTTDYLHSAQIVRADNRMLLAIYLSGQSGGPSPTMQLRGPLSSYFVKYAEQFNIMWNRGKVVDDSHLQRILKENRGLPPPPPEN